MLEDPIKKDVSQVPYELQQALGDNSELRSALRQTGMPTDFQAMVLGLATLRRLNPKRRRC